MNRRIIKVLLSMLVVLMLPLSGLAGPSGSVVTQAAVAPKSTLGSGPFIAGSQVTIQIEITKPTGSFSVDPVEVMVALDLSGSVSSQITQTKQRLLDFANRLQPYHGFVRVGIYKFGAGTGGFPAATISAGNQSSLVAAINTLEAAGAGIGTSDIRQGIIDANNGFSDGSGRKYLVLLTDGTANHPYAQGGRCPMRISNGGLGSRVAGVGNLKSTDFVVIPITGQNTQYTLQLAEFISQGYDPCAGSPSERNIDAYVQWRNGRGIPSICQTGSTETRGCDVVADMSVFYPNSSLQSEIKPTLDSALTELAAINTVRTMAISERLRSDIFDVNAGIKNIQVFPGCGTTATTTGVSLFPAINLGLVGHIALPENSPSRYCLRFTATIKDDAQPGTPPVNTPGNVIHHRNSSGGLIQIDDISEGQVSIGQIPPPPSVSPTPSVIPSVTPVVTTQHPWLQIGVNAGNFSGDVHSNSAISMNIPGNNALFTSGVAGVITHHGTALGFNPSTSSDWSVGSYPQVSNKFFSMTGVMDHLNLNIMGSVSASSLQGNMTCGTAVSGQLPANAVRYLPSNGQLTIGSWPDGHCPIVIVGSADQPVTVRVNQSMPAPDNLPRLMLIYGNLFIHGSVDRVDGFFAWTGHINDAYQGPTDRLLTVNGSLLALNGSQGFTHTGTASGLRRSIPDANTNPSEVIVYQPGWLYQLSLAGASTYTWSENR